MKKERMNNNNSNNQHLNHDNLSDDVYSKSLSKSNFDAIYDEDIYDEMDEETFIVKKTFFDVQLMYGDCYFGNACWDMKNSDSGIKSVVVFLKKMLPTEGKFTLFMCVVGTDNYQKLWECDYAVKKSEVEQEDDKTEDVNNNAISSKKKRKVEDYTLTPQIDYVNVSQSKMISDFKLEVYDDEIIQIEFYFRLDVIKSIFEIQ